MRLTHVRLLVSDFSGCFRFYEDALGLPTSWDDNGGYAEFAAGEGVVLAIFPRTEMSEAVGTTALPAEIAAQDRIALVLEVDDVDAAAAELADKGIPLAVEPHDRPDWGLRVAHVRDPDGNLVELYHEIAWVRE